MAEDENRTVGPFTLLGKKFMKKKSLRQHSAKLRHLLGESANDGYESEGSTMSEMSQLSVRTDGELPVVRVEDVPLGDEPTENKCSGDSSAKSVASTNYTGDESVRIRRPGSERSRSNVGKNSDEFDESTEDFGSRQFASSQSNTGEASSMSELTASQRSSGSRMNAGEIIDCSLYNDSSGSSKQMDEQSDFSKECHTMDEMTEGMKNMNKSMNINNEETVDYCSRGQELDAADKFSEGCCSETPEITDYDSVAESRKSSTSDSVKVGKNGRRVRRKNNLYDESPEETATDSGMDDQGLPINNKSRISQGSTNSRSPTSPRDEVKDGLLNQFGERQSMTGAYRKRHFSSNASDYERKMTSPLSSRSSSIRSHASSIPASIDSGLRMGFQEPHSSVVVVAIDFGTTFSGYAFAFTRDPESIHMMRKWEGGDPGVNNQKIPTTLLLKPDGQFHSFGFGARDFYHDLDPSDAKKWLYFEKFKMTLHYSEVLNPAVMLKAANGKAYPAVKVFAHALRFFKEHVLAELSDQSTAKILEDDITWVLTVPAIWRQPAKQFMRTAAHEAGIASWNCSERLLIALEPEAASIFCRKLRIRDCIIEDDVRMRSQDDSLISEDFIGATQYIVVDCGGGTVDLTVHELDVNSGTLKELQRGTGGPCGAIRVDEEFENLLKRIFDADFIERFKSKRPAGWVDLIIAFESKKRTARPGGTTALNISLPYSFIDYYKKKRRSNVENAIKKFKNPDIKWSSQGMLRIAPSIMEELFQPVLRQIVDHIRSLLEKPSLEEIRHLFLVGGFAESPLLQTAVRQQFRDRVRVVIPHDVGLTILKGAVLFGLDPTVVRVRRSAFTYGVGVLNKFNSERHDISKRVVKDGVVWCKDIFDSFVTIDESVGLGDRVTRSYAPARSGQKSTVINIYCSEKAENLYTTDKKVKRCGQLRIEMPELKIEDIPVEKRSKPRELQATMLFGDTELKVTAVDVLTGKTAKAVIDFLNY